MNEININMKNYIKKVLKVIFNFQPMRNYYPHARLWEVMKWKAGRLVRNLAILGLFVGVGYGSARIYNALNPLIVPAEAKVVTVKEGVGYDDIPMLVKICNAESGGRQFEKNGDVLRGKIDRSDIGYCQINERYNNDEARKLGYDIYTEKGNKDYAVWLYLHRGEQPWSASKGVWSK